MLQDTFGGCLVWTLPKQGQLQLKVVNSRGLNTPKDGDSTTA